MSEIISDIYARLEPFLQKIGLSSSPNTSQVSLTYGTGTQASVNEASPRTNPAVMSPGAGEKPTAADAQSSGLVFAHSCAVASSPPNYNSRERFWRHNRQSELSDCFRVAGDKVAACMEARSQRQAGVCSSPGET